MKYLHLIWAALFRRKSRTFLTLVSIIAAFVLFGLLDSVRVAFTAGNDVAGAGRLIVNSKMSMQQPLPESLGARIATVPGVAAVASANWFGGVYQDPKNQVVSFAVSPNYFDLYPELNLPADQRAIWGKTRTGAVVGAALAKRFGWKIGDKIPLQSTIFPSKASGNQTWTFDIVGIFHARDPAQAGREQMLMFHWKYFDENNAFGSGTVHWYVVKVAHPAQADAVAHAIDAISANSDHETKAQTEQAFQASFIKQMVNIGFIVTAIMGAVFFTLLLLTGNTMMQAVRERTNELAVLKTIGFSNTSVLAMVLAEGVLMLVLGGAIGLALVSLIVPALSAKSGGMMPVHAVAGSTWLVGVLLMVLIGAVVGLPPALRAMRLNIVEALRMGA
ncbi:ABC transporter permease [Rhodanobacter glycinis]|uniref:Putative ABC transport system permease protein n=1 Tax=Rhodanobacter glycinis TaxID=582702 RepID=A0A1I3ZZH5_9GAMM|nr:ABC transporter permease [Rhodanobacter glycinis]SFK49267.1 putative ABC transport system permease protein [Rhodanobacter glycinis]